VRERKRERRFLAVPFRFVPEPPSEEEVKEDARAVVNFYNCMDLYLKSAEMEEEALPKFKFLFKRVLDDCDISRINGGYGDCETCLRWLPVIQLFQAAEEEVERQGAT